MLDFSHFGPFEKLISQVDPRKTYPKNGPFWGARVAGAGVQQDGASRFGAVPPPTWRGDAEVARGSALDFYFCFICLIFFSRLGTHKNQP